MLLNVIELNLSFLQLSLKILAYHGFTNANIDPCLVGIWLNILQSNPYTNNRIGMKLTTAADCVYAIKALYIYIYIYVYIYIYIYIYTEIIS